MRSLRLLLAFVRASAQEEMAHRAHLATSLLHSALSLITGLAALTILFQQAQQIRGWSYPAALALLGVYLLLGGLHRLVIGTSLEALAGLGGSIWTGRFDFDLLRPTNIQFLTSFRRWRFPALVDVALSLVVLTVAVVRLGGDVTAIRVLTFLVLLVTAMVLLYAVLLAFAALVFWSPGFLFTWLFNTLWQMARYPLGLYPGAVRLVLTWVVPVGLMTTVPAQALAGQLSPTMALASLILAPVLLLGSSALFRGGLRRYASASS